MQYHSEIKVNKKTKTSVDNANTPPYSFVRVSSITLDPIVKKCENSNFACILLLLRLSTKNQFEWGFQKLGAQKPS